MNNKKAEHHEYLLSDLVNFRWFQSELIFLFYICYWWEDISVTKCLKTSTVQIWYDSINQYLYFVSLIRYRSNNISYCCIYTFIILVINIYIYQLNHSNFKKNTFNLFQSIKRIRWIIYICCLWLVSMKIPISSSCMYDP